MPIRARVQAYFAKKLRQAAAAHIENAATLAAVDLQTVAKEAAAFAATTDPRADLQRVCDVGKDRPFVWFQADAHLAVTSIASQPQPCAFHAGRGAACPRSHNLLCSTCSHFTRGTRPRTRMTTRRLPYVGRVRGLFVFAV